MDRASFLHPEFCPRVARRRITLDLLELLDLAGTVVASHGTLLRGGSDYPDRRPYLDAQSRLMRQGLIAHRPVQGGNAQLVLTPNGARRLPATARPDARWQCSWRGWWYVIAYDVPENERRYRDALRAFLKRMRMGCLQGSVWISPFDLRPEFDDLSTAAGVDSYAFLFRSRNPFGRSSGDVVRHAWDWETIHAAHSWYIETCRRNLEIIDRQGISRTAAADLLGEETAAYDIAMTKDPLLPGELLPPSYQGRIAFDLHRQAHCLLARFL